MKIIIVVGGRGGGGGYAPTIALLITLLCLASHVHNTQRTDYCRCSEESLKKKATNNKNAYNNMQACATCAAHARSAHRPRGPSTHVSKGAHALQKGRDNIIIINAINRGVTG